MPDSEKITINMSTVDLGKVDLLIQEGPDSNRTDFIRTAIRAQIEKHTFEVQQSVARNAYVIGVLICNRKDLERIKARGEKLKLMLVGMLNLTDGIPPELAAEAIESTRVRGIFNATPALKTALADRMK